MAYYQKYSMTIASTSGVKYTVRIDVNYQYSGPILQLTGAADAMSWMGKGEESMDTCVCGSTGSIRFVTNNADIPYDLQPMTATARRVRVYRDSTDLIWLGFIGMEQYSGNFEAAPYEVEFPVVSALEVTDKVQLPKYKDLPGYMNKISMRQVLMGLLEMVEPDYLPHFNIRLNDNEGLNEEFYALNIYDLDNDDQPSVRDALEYMFQPYGHIMEIGTNIFIYSERKDLSQQYNLDGILQTEAAAATWNGLLTNRGDMTLSRTGSISQLVLDVTKGEANNGSFKLDDSTVRMNNAQSVYTRNDDNTDYALYGSLLTNARVSDVTAVSTPGSIHVGVWCQKEHGSQYTKWTSGTTYLHFAGGSGVLMRSVRVHLPQPVWGGEGGCQLEITPSLELDVDKLEMGVFSCSVRDNVAGLYYDHNGELVNWAYPFNFTDKKKTVIIPMPAGVYDLSIEFYAYTWVSGHPRHILFTPRIECNRSTFVPETYFKDQASDHTHIEVNTGRQGDKLELKINSGYGGITPHRLFRDRMETADGEGFKEAAQAAIQTYPREVIDMEAVVPKRVYAQDMDARPIVFQLTRGSRTVNFQEIARGMNLSDGTYKMKFIQHNNQ